jgi:hypothetical protein
VFRFLVLAIAAIFRPRALLIAEKLGLRQKLLVLGRARHPRARLRSWIGASGFWQADGLAVGVASLLIVKPSDWAGWLLDLAIFSTSEGL